MNTTPNEGRTIHLHVICLIPPPDVQNDEPTLFGLQDNKKQLEPGQHQSDGSIHFACNAGVKCQADHLRFSGPFVHGPSREQFLYLAWRRVSEPDVWIRRWKIMLAPISWQQIPAISIVDQGCLEVSIGDMSKARVALLGEGWAFRT